MNLQMLRKSFVVVWILFLLACLFYFLINPAKFTPEGIAETLSAFNGSLLVLYSLTSFLRGFTLIPSTPFVLAGAILFPENPFLVLAISLGGITFSSILIYYFSDFLGFAEYIDRLHSSKIGRIQYRLEKPSGFLFVFLWAFLPFLPTDLICYISGTLRMNFAKFILALILGELILCYFYIFFSRYSFDLIRQFV